MLRQLTKGRSQLVNEVAAIHTNYKHQTFVGQTLNIQLYPLYAPDIQDVGEEEELVGFGIDMVGEETGLSHFTAYLQFTTGNKPAKL